MFCGMKYTGSITSGAPGAQAYFNNKVGDYRFQALGGIYLPGILNYDTQDFGNLLVDGSPQKNTQNNKYGVSFNLLNTYTGTQFRLSWIQSNQIAETQLNARGHQIANIFYAGADFKLSPNWNLKLTRTDQFGFTSSGETLPDGVRVDLPGTNIHFSNTSAEIRYLAGHSDTLALAYTLYQYTMDLDYPLSSPDLSNGINGSGFFKLSRHSVAGSWRHDWDSGFFTVLQASYTYVNHGYAGARHPVNAFALGLRLGFTL